MAAGLYLDYHQLGKARLLSSNRDHDVYGLNPPIAVKNVPAVGDAKSRIADGLLLTVGVGYFDRWNVAAAIDYWGLAQGKGQ